MLEKTFMPAKEGERRQTLPSRTVGRGTLVTSAPSVLAPRGSPFTGLDWRLHMETREPGELLLPR